MLVSDLQTDIVVGEDSITGTLEYVTGFDDYSLDPLLQDGNFLVLNVDTDTEEDYTITVQVEGSTLEPIVVTQDSDPEDHIMVFRISDPEEETIKVIFVIDGEDPVIKEYILSDLICKSEPVDFNLITTPAQQSALILNQLVSALQEDDVAITPTGESGDNTADITGTLKYMLSFSDYSEDPELQKGNFLALQIISTPAEADVTIEVDEDGTTYEVLNKDQYDNFVIRITDLTGEISITLEYEGDTAVWKFDPTDLICKSEPVDFNLITTPAQQSALILNQLVSALQEDDVAITPTGESGDNTADITGTLKYMLSFSDYSEDPELQKGNFLALQIISTPAEADVTIEVDEDGTKYEVLNKDVNNKFVIRVTELTGEITITLEYHSYMAVWKFDLTGLVLTPAS